MAKELKARSMEELHQFSSHIGTVLFDLRSYPLIIAMKGHNCTGRKLAATLLAITLKCLLLKEEDIHNETYKVICRMVESQVKYGLSVVIDSDLSNRSLFSRLENMAKSTLTRLVIVECKPNSVSDLWDSLEREEDKDYATRWWDKPSSLEDLESLIDSNPDYNTGKTPKFFISISPGMHFVRSFKILFGSIVDLFRPQPTGPICKNHHLILSSKKEDEEVDCNECSQRVSGSVFICLQCNFIFHKSCTKLPQILHYRSDLLLKEADQMENETRCNCCRNILKGNYYTHSDPENITLLDLDCIFLPFKCKVKFHKHELERDLFFCDYTCDACGLQCDQRISYSCRKCLFMIDPKCCSLPDVVDYERHRHPFKLSASPRYDSDEYYCDICQELRNPDHLIYYCAECDYPTHIPAFYR